RGNTSQPIRFQGQWHDEESGLYYNRHRYYDPQQGRYISQDPIGLNGGTNLYGYVTNPTGMVDPLGLTGAHPWNHSYIPIEDRGATVLAGEVYPVAGQAFGGVFGQTIAAGVKADTAGNIGWVVAECQQYGLGIFKSVGTSYAGSISSSSLQSGVSETWGIFGNGGLFGSAGYSIDFNNDGLSKVRGFKGLGIGFSGGIQHCKTTTTIIKEGEE
ncbi:RHS repeat-associated core domain-containing protein, partial [Vreelandella olivaria]|uniref:RHS repeat-associated core domain-containing protein n=1 Tax=Vreelandella olivaria TaxID=390919 RepID=UPI00201FB1C1